jgi:hypothetical protein
LTEVLHDIDPEVVGERWLHAMRRGDFEAAWQATDLLEQPRRRAQRGPGFAREPHHLVWDGTPLAGRSVLVRCLHGLGDTLQFMRFVPRIAAQARELHFLVQPALLDLLHGLPGLGRVSNAWTDHPPAHEVEIEVMELAYALRCTAATVAPPYPRLAARAAALLPWELPRDDALRVGLVWSASDWDPTRSLALDALQPLADTPGVRLYSLQQGDAARSPQAEALGLVPLWKRTGRIVDAAAALMHMDLLVCVDGMPAHLAGTLGRPAWVLLKHEADWRWMHARKDSPWYPTVRLFRQPKPGDWVTPIREAAAALAELTALRPERR